MTDLQTNPDDGLSAVTPAALASCREPGLHLILQNGDVVSLTVSHVQALAEEMWRDEDRLPSEVREAADFQRCDICPLLVERGICDAIRPLLPLLERIDPFESFDSVTAVYREEDNPDVMHMARTTMQHALQYVSTLSLMCFCRNGHKYWQYFRGISPLLDPPAVAERLYLNMYWLCRGDLAQVSDLVKSFQEDTLLASQNQIKRLALICKEDAFANAFVETQTATVFLGMDMEKRLKTAFDTFGGQFDEIPEAPCPGA